MIKFLLKNKNPACAGKQKGYALLFTIVIVSAISVVTAGLTSTVYKQMVLSSLAKDSQAAFYQADTASECAMYADLVLVYATDSTFLTTDIAKNWSCGGMSLEKVITDPATSSYKLMPTGDESNSCFEIYVTKKSPTIIDGVKTITTEVKAKGYNTCDKSSPRAVEREIDTNYNQYQ